MFVTLEGPEGSGKTTLCARLEHMLADKGYEVVCVREPGGTVIGQQVRDVLLDQGNTGMLPETEFLLFSASRAQLVREVVVPHLESGAIVLCDRFLDSSLAYQGYGHRLDVGVLEKISSFVTSGVTPDVTVLLDISPEEGLRRRKQDPETWNRLDAYAIDFQGKYTQMLIDETDYPNFDIKGVNRTFMDWKHNKKDDIMGFRDKSHASLMTGTQSPDHHTPWLEALDDSLEAYLKQEK